MAKIVLDTVTGGYDLSVINTNFDKIETELQNKVLYRDNPVGEPNTLQTDVDANTKRIFNLPVPTLSSEAARLQDVQNAVAGGAANLITFTPYGHVAGSNVQAAIQELVDDTTNNGTTLPVFLKDSNAIVVDSIAALKAIDKTKFTKALVLGYYTKGDGGGGVYWFDSTDTTSSDNGGTIIVASDGGRWKLFNQGYINVRCFGALPSRSASENVTAIQAAINVAGAAGGGIVYIPNGTYSINAELLVSSAAVAIVGETRYGTLLKQETLNAKIFNISGSFCSVRTLSLIYNGTPLTGATAIYVTNSSCTLQDFVIRSSYVAVHFNGSSAVAGKLTSFEILDYESAGLIAQSLNDLYVSRFVMNAGNASRGILGGIRLIDKVEAFICSDGDILLGQYSMTMVATVYDVGTRPAYNNFSNVFFDSAVLPTQINKCVETEFIGCWFSGGRSGAGSAGALVENCQSIRFTNCKFFNCGASGVVVDATASDITFIACKAESNSVTAGSAVSHGFQFVNNVLQFQIIGCTASNGLHPGVQGYGILIGSGCNQFTIRDCNLVGNATGPLNDGTVNTADKTIHGNIGYRTSNTGEGVIAVGQTVAAVTHGLAATPRAQDITLTFSEQAVARGVTNVYVTAITSTDFQIASNAAVATDDLTVGWTARIKGA